jgi:pSer/pThr/pTyr-binding forkhead associated (FHA) protein
MEDPIAVALKFGFLAVLYLFLLWVARSAVRDLAATGRAEVEPEPAPPPDASARQRRRDEGADLRAGVQPRLEVIAAMGYEPGMTFDIGGGATMGRADSSDIPIDDPFASSAHARIFPRGQFMYIEDMGSTNGTYLNGRQLRTAERLKVGDLVRIGDSEYRYQE